ncbi:hypothetical protein C1646_761245 [Rhizophagus diaphanus]|nr:hypothetical protein C1646_761245 [Rhizophagus diaphanus] [Rhizophagus sp. MUCL 43196]
MGTANVYNSSALSWFFVSLNLSLYGVRSIMTYIRPVHFMVQENIVIYQIIEATFAEREINNYNDENNDNSDSRSNRDIEYTTTSNAKYRMEKKASANFTEISKN